MDQVNQVKASNFMITIPHSGEEIPPEASWLKKLPEEILMCDVDRYVDILYDPTLKAFEIPSVKTNWHRYAGDLNRLPDDVDAGSVEGHPTPAGPHLRGFHWVITTTEVKLMPQPISKEIHQKLVDRIYTPFHAQVQGLAGRLKKLNGVVYHIDAHSMPSVGTKQHKDPGQRRADIVVSDSLGKSSSAAFKDLVIQSYKEAGFNVAYNWPYVGGRLTEQYGRPQENHHTIQVELNRDLYMDEKTKKLKSSHIAVQTQIQKAIEAVIYGIPNL
jgi:N-formylglutamate amidohydrolase